MVRLKVVLLASSERTNRPSVLQPSRRSTRPPTPYSLLPRRPRRAYTLTELLIVITIMIMLMAITLPAVKQVMRDSGVREASRQLNAYFAMAKARALLTGRPCGVMMRCDLPVGINDPTHAPNETPVWPARIVTQLYLAEVPPPYSGSTTNTVGKIFKQPGGPNTPYIFDSSTPGEMAMLSTLVEPGEFFLVRFNYKGEWYRCVRGSANNSAYPDPSISYFLGGATTFPPGYNDTTAAGGWPFQILRQPRRIGNPLELTAGTCIDLAYSGIGPTNLPMGRLHAGMYPVLPGNTPPSGLFGTSPYKLEYVTVMFLPGGGIESIYLNNYVTAPATTVHFLVGKTDKVNLPLGQNSSHPTRLNMYDPESSNLADPLSLWVSVARSTGNVNTAENAPPEIARDSSGPSSITINPGPSQQPLNPTNPNDQIYFLSLCRRLATNREQVRAQ